MTFVHPWVRRQVIRLALRYPRLITVLFLLFLFTVSNHIEFATGMAVRISPLWHTMGEGLIVATFGAFLLYEAIRLYREFAELQMVHIVVRSLHHEINNPLTFLLLSAERLQALNSYDETTVRNILAQGSHIRDVVAKLSQLEEKVLLHEDPGFRGLLDLARSA